MIRFLIIGRTGTGKDTLKETLEKDYGWKFVKSYTTRKPRYDGEDTHIFITHEEAKNFKDYEKIASTLIKNDNDIPDEYFATIKQVLDADAYIIDPIGAEKLIKNIPNVMFEILYIKAPDTETQKNMAIGRADNPEMAKQVFEKRYESEDAQFTEFEKNIESKEFGSDNCNIIMQTTNNYSKEWLKDMAFNINSRKTYYNNANYILNDLINARILDINHDGKIKVQTDTGEHYYDLSHMAQMMSLNIMNLGYILEQWLKMPNTILSRHRKEQSSNVPDIRMKDYLYDIMQPMVEEGEYLDDKINDIVKEIQDDDEFYQTLDNYLMPIINKKLGK